MTKEEQLSRGKSKTPRSRKCLTCREYFKPKEKGITTCSPECAILYAKSNFTKQVVKEKRKAKRKHYENDKSELLKKAQFQFNKYIRLRDAALGCISCGNTTRQMHAGHFKTVGGNGNLRFNEDNCNKQCSICNNYLSGNIGEYEKKLRLKIGDERVDALDIKEPKSWSVEELKQIIDKYKDKIKEL